MQRPLLLPLVSIVSGVAVAGLLSCFLPPVMVPICLAIAALTIFSGNRVPFLVSIAGLFFLYGNLALKPILEPALGANHIASYASPDAIIVEGIVDSRPESVENGCRIYLKTEHVMTGTHVTPVTGRLQVLIGEGRSDVMTGDRVRFASRIRRPRNLGLPGEFDFVRYLAYRDVFATAFVKDSRDVLLVRKAFTYHVQRKIDTLAADMGRFIAKNTPSNEGAILRALLLGDMGNVSEEVKDAYTRAGVNHILSISGFHIGIIAFFVFHLLLFAARGFEYLLLRANIRRVLLLVTLPMLIFYLFLTGAAPATLRSVIMIATYIVALMLEREVDPLNSLILAALAILAFNPPALFDISFQLSFLALWGILTLTPLFMTPFARISQGTLKKLLTFTMVSAAAISVTLLPVAYYFHRTSLAGLLTNFFIVPIMGYGAVITGFCALPLIHLFPSVASIFLTVSAFLVRVSDTVIMVMAKFPVLPPFNPSKPQLAFFYLLLASLSLIRSGKLRLLAGSSLSILCIGSGFVGAAPDKHDLNITFFSIGQGEASLVTFPDGRRMLIDGGGSVRESSKDVGKRLLAPALWRMGVKRLDYVVLSHPHPDHLQGLRYILENFSVGEFWESGVSAPTDDYREVKRVLAMRGITVRTVNLSTPPVHIGGCQLEVLSPFASPGAQVVRPSADLNDDSLVLRLSRDKFAVLFTGDIGFPAEAMLVRTPEKLRCTLLKVAHHGSSHSSSTPFLAAAAPQAAVISAGYDNNFHLPTRQTLDALKQTGAHIYRTDIDGTIVATVSNNGEKVSLAPLR